MSGVCAVLPSLGRPCTHTGILPPHLLSSSPAQAGQLRLSMVHAHADLFARVRDNARVSLCRAAACLTDNAPIEDGLQALGDLHGALCCLILAFQRLPKELALTPDSMAFHIMATNVLTSATQVRGVLWRKGRGWGPGSSGGWLARMWIRNLHDCDSWRHA